ncbi:MAG: PfkB family carbohydrate kinase [Gemmatimonadaceae bacterium]
MPNSLARERLASLLRSAAGRRIAIVGDAMLDVYLKGDVERISPEAPVPVVRVRERVLALGGAANVAQNVAALGAIPELVALVGDDPAGTELRRLLAGIGAGAGSLIPTSRPTTTKTRIQARMQQVVRYDEEDDGDVGPADTERALALADRALAVADALIIEDYNKGLLTPPVIERVIGIARARGIPIVVDPKYRNFFCYGGATVFKPNRRELEAALGAAVDVSRSDMLPEVVRRLGVEHVLLTLGELGMVLVARDGLVHRVPTTARGVYDVVGAGDTVTAYLAAMLAAGASAREASVVANFAAGVEVGKPGAATVTGDEVLAAYDSYGASPGAGTTPRA